MAKREIVIDENFRRWLKVPDVIAIKNNGDRYAIMPRSGHLLQVKTPQLYVGADGQREALSRDIDAGLVRFVRIKNDIEIEIDIRRPGT